MPFNFEGNWIPSPENTQPKKPVKVHTIKRKNKVVTAVSNLPLSSEEISHIASKIKKDLGVGGSVKEDVIEIQGDKVDLVKIHLRRLDLIK